MKRLFTFFACMAFLFSQNVDAQVYIWGGPGDVNSEFDGGLNDWTVVSASPNDAALWIWKDNGAADQGAYAANIQPIASPSVANGAATFDSDYLDNDGVQGNFGMGASPSPQVAELISPEFSCDGHESVVIKYHQAFRNFQATPYVSVTVDGGATWIDYYWGGEEVPLNSGIQTHQRVRMIDISDIAANQPNVQFKFVWSGEYYYWTVDDVWVMETPEREIELTAFYYPAGSFQKPQSQIDADEFEFLADVANQGSMDVNEVVLTATVLDENDAILFQDSTSVDMIAVGDTIEMVIDATYSPEALTQGAYRVIYDVKTNDGDDFVTEDNVRGEFFNVNADLYQKDSEAVGIAFSYGDNYAAGNLYTTGSWDGVGPGNFIATDAFFIATNGGGDGVMTADVKIYLYEVKSTVADDYSDFEQVAEIGQDLLDNESMTLIGFASQTLNGDDFGDFNVELLDFIETEPGAPLQADHRYLLMAHWDNQGVFHGTDETMNYYQVASIIWADDGVGTNTWYLDGGGSDQTTALGMLISFASTTDEEALAEDVMEIFPNPTADYLNVRLDFETATPATIAIADVNGRLLNTKSFKGAVNETEKFDVSDYASGTYLVRIITEEGTKTMKFIVD